MKLAVAAALALFLCGLQPAWAEGADQVEMALHTLMILCVGGGQDVTIKSNSQNQVQIDANGQSFVLERHEAQGLSNGLTQMNAIQADQANRVRECLEPYRSKLMETLLFPMTPHPEPRAVEPPPPLQASTLLNPAYRTDFDGEAEDFGVTPILGLNPNVNNYTPAYINGGSVITSGELNAAILSGKHFYLIDVWSRPHMGPPGSILVPDAGLVDPNNDAGKQIWFVNRLLQITRGDYGAPVVFYCAGVRCWESFNASRRAIIGGFSNVYWYRGGVGAWNAAGNAMRTQRQPPPNWCAYAHNEAEAAICKTAGLSALDAQLSGAFENAIGRSSGSQQQQLKRDEQTWLGYRDACGANTNCLQNVYVSRIQQLNAN